MMDFFISYTATDRTWAEWIAWKLEEAGFSTVIQAWDFQPGSNFVLAMHDAASNCARTVAVLSPDYLASVFTQSEWAAAFASDPTGAGGTLLPVRVAPCDIPGILRPIVYCDLVGLAEPEAKEKLLAAAKKKSRTKPVSSPAFPGTHRAFPGRSASSATSRVSPTMDAARALYDILQTTRTTFLAQNRLRNQVVAAMRERLGIKRRYQYEPFFRKFYDQMNDEEHRLHATIRSYTANVLSDYNARAYELVEQHPELGQHLPSVPALKRHLIIWLGKYRGVFADTPSMCLVYVGVEEGVPFPKSIDEELRAVLEPRPGGRVATDV